MKRYNCVGTSNVSTVHPLTKVGIEVHNIEMGHTPLKLHVVISSVCEVYIQFFEN